METFTRILKTVDDFVWGPVMLVLLVGTGIYLTVRLKFLTWRNLPYAVRSTLSKEARKTTGSGDVSPFAALTTALAATIGTGNIVGVATAMVSGGPGALVWMWISACFGLSSKFSECMLAIKYREVNERGEMSGGPMYTMRKALKNKNLPAKMLLQVHDELVLEVRNDALDDVQKTVTEAMELNQPLRVPLVADVKIGKTWKDSK